MQTPKIVKHHFRELFTINKSERVWQMPFFAALGVAIMLFVGGEFNRPDLGLVSIVGMNAFFYIPNTTIFHRMIVMMGCAFGIGFCFALGLIGHFFPTLTPLLVGGVTIMSAIITRYYDLGAPGYFYFVYACILGTVLPLPQSELLMSIGLVTIGGVVANLLGILYNFLVIHVFKNNTPKPVPERGELGFDVIVVDPVIIGFFVGLSVFFGDLLGLERSYWASVSCAIIMGGVSLKAVWFKQLGRIMGTIIGVALSWWLLTIRFELWEFTLLMMFLIFTTHYMIVRNYVIAIICVTPFSMYLAEAINFMNYDPNLIIKARVYDTIIGSVLGLIGGAVLHYRPLRMRIAHLAMKVLSVRDIIKH